jgi:hypothetical protein
MKLSNNQILVALVVVSFLFIMAVFSAPLVYPQDSSSAAPDTAFVEESESPALPHFEHPAPQTDIPPPITDQLPDAVTVILGLVSALIVEFIQKQKSKLASLGIAVGVSAVGGVISAFIVGASFSDFPVFIVQTFVMASAMWATLFNGLGLKKFLYKSLS